MLKVLVCGGRDFTDQMYLFSILSHIHTRGEPIGTIVHGAANGADFLAGEWARTNNVREEKYKVSQIEWQKYGRYAGIRRNGIMLNASVPDLVVAFPGHNGTDDMIKKAQQGGFPVEIYNPMANTRRTFAREPGDTGYNHIALVGGSVVLSDVKAGGPYLGFTKKYLEDVAWGAGVNLFECVITCVFMEPPVNNSPANHFYTERQARTGNFEICMNRLPITEHNRTMYLIESQEFEISRLAVELAKWKPRIILALGRYALWALTGEHRLHKVHGKLMTNELTGYGYVIPTFNPTSLHKDSTRSYYLIEDFKFAKERAKLKLPRHLFTR